MRAFKKNHYKKDRVVIVSCLIFFFICIFLTLFSKFVSPGIVNISKLKVNEVTTNIVNNAVLNYKKNNINLNDLIITKNNSKEEIIAVDINMDKAYIVLEDIMKEIRENIKKFQKGQYQYYNMESLKIVNNGLVIAIPLGAMAGKNLVVNLGPRIPVKLSLLENVKINLRTEVKQYGINNSLINLYIKVNIEQNIEMPSEAKSFFYNYEMLLSSKLVYGVVPDFFGGYKGSEEEIVNIPVN